MAAKVLEIAGHLMSKWDLNNPPTAVGGIPKAVIQALFRRLDINYPPTAVGGILTFAAKPHICNCKRPTAKLTGGAATSSFARSRLMRSTLPPLQFNDLCSQALPRSRMAGTPVKKL